MVKLYKFIGFLSLIAGIIIILSIIILFQVMNDANKIYYIAGGTSAIIYGIIALVKASYFENLERATRQAEANTKLILDYLNKHPAENQTPPPTPAAGDPLASWKRKE